MTTAAIVQARMGSSRLPGKVLHRIGNRTVLEHVLDRCRRIRGVDVVVCATTMSEDCGPISDLARAMGVEVVTGSETDVLDRYCQAARVVGAEVVLRATADNPMIDPGLCAAVLALRSQYELDYTCNNFTPTWPYGIDCEAFTADLLFAAERYGKTQDEREHVTLWMRDSPSFRRGNVASSHPEWTNHRWTIDYEEDLTYMRALYERHGHPGELPNTLQALEILARHPELSMINGGRMVRSRTYPPDEKCEINMVISEHSLMAADRPEM